MAETFNFALRKLIDKNRGIKSRQEQTGMGILPASVKYQPRQYNNMTKQRQNPVVYLVDMLILTGSFLLVALYKPATARYLSDEYLYAFGGLAVVWTISSFYFKKYSFRKKHGVDRLVRVILLSNFVSLGSILIFFTLFWISGYSRLMLFGTVTLATLLELFAGNLYSSLIRTKTIDGHDPHNPPPHSWEIAEARSAADYSEYRVSTGEIRTAVEQECGPGIYEFMARHIEGDGDRTLIVSTGSRFNIEMQPEGFYRAVVNMKRVNDIRLINKFFESVNRKLPEGGIFIGCAETTQQRKKRILKKYPPLLRWVMYLLDYILKRVFPKFLLTRKFYYLVTRGNNRVLSRAELLGRLYSCGFELVEDEFVNGLYCYSVRKKKEPVYDLDPTYGAFIKLRRIGKAGSIIRVYKFRTMHPYSEYLQDFMLQRNNLDKGGKYRNDFRVTTLGGIMRALWIDELPMLLNLLKGDVKPVGIRPLSPQYFALYDKDLQERRIKYRPGLVPPFYADMPHTLQEIQDSERRYLDSYDRRPLLTDTRYFFRAMWNIIFKKARSR